MRHLIAACLLVATPAMAADHADAPGTQADPAADIADLYAWYEGDDVRLALTFNGLMPAGSTASYDRDVLYQFHIDSNMDNVADQSIEVRFGQDADGIWGVQALNMPGTDEPVSGEVGDTISEDGTRLWAGLREDPFFFDLTGFEETLETGDLSIMSTRDTFAGTNVMAIVVEFDREDVSSTEGGAIAVWATTSRIGG